MNKTKIAKFACVAAVLSAASSLTAQSFTAAAFDFRNLPVPGVFADEPSFVDEGSYTADFADGGVVGFDGVLRGAGPTSATLFVDGTFGSSDIASLPSVPGDPLLTTDGETTINRTRVTGELMSGTATDPEAFGINTDAAEALFTFSLDLGPNVLDSSEASSFSFVSRATGASAGATLSWEYSTDAGSSWVDIAGFEQTLGTSYALASTDALDGFSGDLLVRGTVSGLTSGPGDSFGLDNVQFNAVVPEPSTYAAIFGAIALGVAMIRRRMKK